MNNAPLTALIAALAGGCSSPTPPAVDHQEPAPAALPEANLTAREANLAAYERDGARLAAESPGQWVLISGGVTSGPWSTFEEAWAAVEETASTVPHAFLYRAGVDDVDVTFYLSPFRSSDPHWTQIGRRLRKPMRLTIAAAGNVWARKVNGETLTVAWGDLEAQLLVTAPDGSKAMAVRGVASQMFEEDLCITADVAEELGLGRIEAPGAVFYAKERWPCSKVVARLRVPELEIDLPAVAYVLPRALTDTLSLGAPSAFRVDDD